MKEKPGREEFGVGTLQNVSRMSVLDNPMAVRER